MEQGGTRHSTHPKERIAPLGERWEERRRCSEQFPGAIVSPVRCHAGTVRQSDCESRSSSITERMSNRISTLKHVRVDTWQRAQQNSPGTSQHHVQPEQSSHRNRATTSRHLSYQIHSPALINRFAASHPNHTLRSRTRRRESQLLRRTPSELPCWAQPPSCQLPQDTRVAESPTPSRELARDGGGTCRLWGNKRPAPCAAARIRWCE